MSNWLIVLLCVTAPGAAICLVAILGTYVERRRSRKHEDPGDIQTTLEIISLQKCLKCGRFLHGSAPIDHRCVESF